MASNLKDLLKVNLQGQGGAYALGPLHGIKLVGLYFSAHWCPPCRTFTPKLTEYYNLVNDPDKKLEIVFVSLDKTKNQFDDYCAAMPWLAIPYDDTDMRDQLTKAHNVLGIPCFILLHPKSGNVITKDARGLVEAKSDLPWQDSN